MNVVSDEVSRGDAYRRVRVESIVASRYGGAERPDSWDERIGGIDVVVIEGGETLKLNSTPMQSPPKPGWVLMLTGGGSEEGFAWTLYGMPQGSHLASPC